MGERFESDDTGSTGCWQRIVRRRRIVLATGAAAVACVAIAAALLGGTGFPDAPSGDRSSTIVPADQTAEATTPVPAYDPADDHEAAGSEREVTGGSVAAPVAGASVPDASGARAGLIAYRRGGWLCVSSEDGSGEVRVAESASGVFSLSPDGSTIAAVDEGAGRLALFDVASGGAVSVGPAQLDPPAWSPDSTWLVYTAPGPHVMRVERSGEGQGTLMSGTMPAVSFDGLAVAAAAPASRPPAIQVWQEGETRSYETGPPVSGLCFAASRIYYGSGPDASGAVSVRSMRFDGREDRAEVSRPDSSRAVVFAGLLGSPDGSWVCYTESGDDGYSRAFALPVSGDRLVALSSRRDCYPLKWSADGATLFMTEGNAIQGDPTWLVSVRPGDGIRRSLVEGATR